jgi:hypothetical protein
MDLMRNGNFDRGINVTNANPVSGVYSGVLVTSNAFTQLVYNNDVIPVNARDIVRVGAYLSGEVNSYTTIGFRVYDKDGLYLASVYGSRYKNLPYYGMVYEDIEVPYYASYISFEIKLYNPGNAKTVYVDLCSLQVNSLSTSLYREIILMDEDTLVADGDSKDFWKMLTGYQTYYAMLVLDADATNTSTCTVSIVERNEVGSWITVGSFTPTAVNAMEQIVLTNTIGRQLAVVYTFGAGVKDCDIEVSVIGKR